MSFCVNLRDLFAKASYWSEKPWWVYNMKGCQINSKGLGTLVGGWDP